MVATREQSRSPILAASRRTQIFAAALIWSLGGVALTTSGIVRLARAGSDLLIPILLGAAVIAVIKTRFAKHA